MTGVSAYLVPARSAIAEIEVKRSRFRCTLERVETEEAARGVVDRVRREHWDARHHCSAFVLGPDAGTQRSSDDGEPSGTAGAPMLEVLRGREVSDVVAVVTRWFGGVLLGTGGLVRAYGDAVRAALDDAGLSRRRLVTEYAVRLPLADAGRVDGQLRARGIPVREVSYAEQPAAVIHAAEPVGESPTLAALVAELTGGSGLVEPTGTRWVDAS
ncbi:IMPACT family protein [Nostocoides japonicum]|nr:YigZ family protein [Tetrasphaera japonica]